MNLVFLKALSPKSIIILQVVFALRYLQATLNLLQAECTLKQIGISQPSRLKLLTILTFDNSQRNTAEATQPGSCIYVLFIYDHDVVVGCREYEHGSHFYKKKSCLFCNNGIYCEVPGSPCLSKNKANQVCDSFFLIFCLGGYLIWSTCGRTKESLAPCLVAARVVRWRPRLAGTRQYNRQHFTYCTQHRTGFGQITDVEQILTIQIHTADNVGLRFSVEDGSQFTVGILRALRPVFAVRDF